MSVNYNWLSAGKRPTRGQVKLLRRDAHAVLAAPAAPALQFQESTCHDNCCDRRRLFCCWREGGYHRDAPPRGTLLTAWGQRSDTAGNFSHALHHVRSSSSAQRRDLTQTGFSKSHILVCRPQHGRGGGTSSSVQSVSSRFGLCKISIMVLALAFPSPGPISRFLLPFP